jgi:hypothetical protein
MSYKNDPRIISAKFAGICAESKKPFKKGDQVLYRPDNKKCYLLDHAPIAAKDYEFFLNSKQAEDFYSNQY